MDVQLYKSVMISLNQEGKPCHPEHDYGSHSCTFRNIATRLVIENGCRIPTIMPEHINMTKIAEAKNKTLKELGNMCHLTNNTYLRHLVI